jgi:hypothetical protein
MANNVQNIKIEPCQATWSIEEQWLLRTRADVSSNLQNKYFFIFKEIVAGAIQKYHVWFNVATLGVDPAPANSIAIPIAISANASAATIATAVAAALEAHAAFTAQADGDEVLITVINPGQSSDFADFNTDMVLTQTQDGGDLDLGYLDGDIEVTFEEQQLDITAHQTGTTVLTALRQGLVNEVSLTMKEYDLEKYRELMLGTAGGTDTPGGGTEVFGWGTGTLVQNTFVKSRRLVLHPVTKDVADYSGDLCFWKAYALPDTLTISGENPKTLGLKFKVYRDDAKPEAINQFVFKDWTQYVPIAP